MPGAAAEPSPGSDRSEWLHNRPGGVPPACMPPLEGMPGTVPAGRATGGHITLLLCMVGLVHVRAKAYTNA